MSILANLPIKFFPKDKLSGSMEKVGDTFTAIFFGTVTEFEVCEVYGDMVMAYVKGDEQ